MIKELSQIKSIEDMIKYAQNVGHKDTTNPIESKANENVDPTTNANWYDQFGMTNSIKNLTSERGQLLSQLSGSFEGNTLPDSFPVPYDVTNYKMKSKTVWRNEARPAFDNQVVTDNKGTIAPKPLILQFGINDEMIANSTDTQIFDYIVNAAVKGSITSAENMIINGDTEAGATGNVNSDDQLPATTFADGAADDSLQIDAGLRERAINATRTINVGTFDSDDLNGLRALLRSSYQNKKSDLLYIYEPETMLMAETDDSLKLWTNTMRPTIDGNDMRAFGITHISHDLVPQTEADGKASGATPAGNILGQVICLYKPALRWGYGRDVQLEVERVQGYGFEITVTMKFGFVLLDNTRSVSAGINITLF